MLLIHTADVHLHPDHPERLAAFNAVCSSAGELKADLLVIAGDLFDSAAAATTLRAEVRTTLREYPYSVLVIAGNHDDRAYDAEFDYGDRVHALAKPDVREYGDVQFVALPYQKRPVEAMLAELPGVTAGSVWVAHAAFFAQAPGWTGIGEDLQEHGEATDCILTPEDIRTLSPPYVALGHWHRPTDPPVAINGSKVAYSGSPCAIDSHELGPRRFAVAEVHAGRPASVRFEPVPDTPYNTERKFFVTPGNEAACLAEAQSFLAGPDADRFANLTVVVTGWIEGDEMRFQDDLQAECGRATAWGRVDVQCSATSFGATAPAAAAQFVERLRASDAPDVNKLEDDELRALAREMLAEPGMSEALRERALQAGLKAFAGKA